MNKLKCPQCGSINIAEYLWGLPVFSEQLDEEIKSGLVILGGCMIDETNPSYHCNDCKEDF